MNIRRRRSDDILFISALVVFFLGLSFLMYTTKAFASAPHAWPILVIAAGGVLLYFALVRGASFTFFSAGVLCVLEGSFLLTSIVFGWRIARSWPVAMAIAGVAGFIVGVVAKKRLKAFYAVPSIGFALLGVVFSLFSFNVVRLDLRSFIRIWWPTILIAGGISLFVAYGLSRHAAKSGLGTRAGKPANRSGRVRGPSSGP